MADFVLESREHLTSIEQRLLTLERDPADTDAIHSVFRGFHSIKGLAGFLEFVAIQELAHEVETALNLVREGKLAILGRVIDVILESVDYLSGAIATVEAGGTVERAPSHDSLLRKVRALMDGDRSSRARAHSVAGRQNRDCRIGGNRRQTAGPRS